MGAMAVMELFTALTERERQVAALVCQGLANKIIARRLNIAEGTVRQHVHTICQKLGVRGRRAVKGMLPENPMKDAAN